MASSDFNLIDVKEKVQKYANKVSSRKLKLKAISWKNISLRWKKFRLEKLRENLAEAKFRESEMKPEHYEKTEKKVMNKATKIADLEAQITFIETGKKSSMKFVETRALNLKNLMMKNLMSNGEYIYSVSSSVADRIKAGNYEIEPKNENKDKDKDKDIPISKPSNELSINNDNSNSTVENTGDIVVDDIVVDDDDTIEVGPEITKESLRAAIEEKMKQLETKEDEERSIVIDGEYSFKGEELPEAGRRDYYGIQLIAEQLKRVQEKIKISKNIGAEVTPFATTSALTISTAPEPVGKTDKLVTKQRYMPVIVENRESSDNRMGISIEKPATEEIDIEEKLAAKIAKGQILKAERTKQESINKAATQRLSDSDSVLLERYAELDAFLEELEADCNAISNDTESVYERIASNNAQIEAIDAILGTKAPSTENNAQKRR